jgi:hypothetical protein
MIVSIAPHWANPCSFDSAKVGTLPPPTWGIISARCRRNMTIASALSAPATAEINLPKQSAVAREQIISG